MSKETYFFSHDYNARADRKLVKLIMKHGMTGIGIYWCIVEMLYEEGGYLPMEYERITFELRSKENVIQSVINDFDLFENDTEKFWSNSVLDRLQKRCDKSEKARESINKRWNKSKENTNVLQSNEERNTIKERKEEESKENESKIKKDSEINFDFITESFNKICTCFPKVLKLNNSRKLKIKTRLAEMQNDLNVIDVLFYKMQSSDFLKGKNEKKWQATFDWVFENDKNWLKVIEGNYDNKKEEKKETFLESSDRKAREVLLKMKENEFARNNQ